ncbi:Iron-sulfur cluster co-chaperone protein HscB, mitochondrial [Vanrija pseudolonga]|uniref:Iron-sulfur cluster co-chaperone protein HscB, mitochondrial n=1 Tax=Vanrija pseudolonga TaxID=143232 RepID=A0AAF0YEJ0_9TREE|nr:Iron-sulfur cluster co-chaperone protein HscB, mitochondrial [Vanrija pseudolonga]
MATTQAKRLAVRAVRGVASTAPRHASRGIATATAARPVLALAGSTIAPAPTLRRAYSSPSAPTRPCPKCAAPIPLPASPCPACGGLVPIPSGLSLHSLLDVSTPLPASSGNGFDIVGELGRLPAHGYALDARDLRNRMLRRQRDLHPDKQAADVDLAADLSGRVNKAYETLASPLRRAEYILKILGKGTEETDAVTDHDLLMEILEARETLEEAEEASEVEEMRDSNHDKVVNLVRRLTEAFSQTPVDLHATKALAVELKYWVGLEEAAKEKLGRLGEGR